MNRRMWAVVRKDAREILASWELLLPMTILPLVFAVLLPALMIHEADAGLKGIPPALRLAAAARGFATDVERSLFLALEFLVPPLFLFIPLITASILAAASFAGEREGRTLETLLYTPLTLRELFLAKTASTLVPAMAVTVASGILLGATVDLLAWHRYGLLPFPNARWLAVLLWLSPAVSAFALGGMTLVSAKARTMKGAQQMSALVVFPFVALLLGWTSGVVMMGIAEIAGLGAALFLAAYLLLRAGAALFTAERLIL